MITVKELTKRYGAHTAVDALSFTVDKGQIYGLLGPNGAGKSTTMNIITGYISATDGTAEIDGCDIFDSPAEARAKIGYLPEQPPLYTDMTPREYLAFAAELKGLPREQRKAAVEQCMERTNIADVADRLIRNLSKGYRQRVGLACALLGDPPVIILDEPTVGLDPKQIIEIRELIRSLGQEHTVLLSSHILSEVNAVCDKVLIMSHGKLVACDTPENLTAHAAGHAALRITVLGTQEAVQAALSPLLEQGAQAVEFVPCEEENAVTARIVCSGGADLRAPAGIALAGAGLAYEKEARLAPRCRADFLCQGGVLVEVKRGAVRRPLLLDQLRRYAALPEVASLVVVTERTVDLPRRVGGKPCAVVALNRLWGVAIG